MRVNTKPAGVNLTLDGVKCVDCGEHWPAGTPVMSGGHELTSI